MKVTTTRTLNPLPFQDLEPHRFEDLIRQLAYDFRLWKSLEATGRSGSDGGQDIRGLELVVVRDDQAEAGEDDEGSPAERTVGERLWTFQCKREKSLAPKRLRAVVAESLASLDTPPHGFVLAVACDVSKQSRDAFREEMVSRGIEEFTIWAKGELEDMLFQPKNDRLLFVYFGLSLTTRRRSITASVRATIALKKQLSALLGGDEKGNGKLVLLRDPADDRYPKSALKGETPVQWIACKAFDLRRPGHLTVLVGEYLAATTSDGETWDALLGYNSAPPRFESELRAKGAWAIEHTDDRWWTPERDFWMEYIAEQDQALLKIYKFVPIERVIAIDHLGDAYYPVPHIFVDFLSGTGPFTQAEMAIVESVGLKSGNVKRRADLSNRVPIFPEQLPDKGSLPPTGFDDTSDEQSSLSESADDKLEKLLEGMNAERATDDVPADAVSRIRNSEEKNQRFGTWREQTALPLFSAFVSRLRARGHYARVVVRSANAEQSIELQVRLRIESPGHASHYRRLGRLRVSMVGWSGWQLHVQPSPDDSASRSYRSTPTPEIENMPQEQLEKEVLGMLYRLKQ